MINKINFNGIKPPKYFMNEKQVKRMILNDTVIYEYDTGECKGITFNESKVTIDVEVIDDTYYKLGYTLSPENCSDEITWEITDPNIIQVTHSKNTREFWITSLSMGSCALTVICGDKSDICVIKVIADHDHEDNIPCTSISCDSEVVVGFNNVTPENGGGVKINVVVNPSDTTDLVVCKVHANKMVYVLQQSDGWYVYSQGYTYGRTTVSFICGDKQADCIVTVS